MGQPMGERAARLAYRMLGHEQSVSWARLSTFMAGGKILIFPHHENEIAQSEAAFEKPFANYWIHNGFVNINHEKMSKSLGNFSMIKDVLNPITPKPFACSCFPITTAVPLISPINPWMKQPPVLTRFMV